MLSTILSAKVMLSLLRNSKNDEAKRRNILDPDPVWDSFPFTWERYELRPVRKVLVSVQRPRRSQSGLSSFSDRSYVNAKKRNLWRPTRTHAGLSSSRSHVNTTFIFSCSKDDLFQFKFCIQLEQARMLPWVNWLQTCLFQFPQVQWWGRTASALNKYCNNFLANIEHIPYVRADNLKIFWKSCALRNVLYGLRFQPKIQYWILCLNFAIYVTVNFSFVKLCSPIGFKFPISFKFYIEVHQTLCIVKYYASLALHQLSSFNKLIISMSSSKILFHISLFQRAS